MNEFEQLIAKDMDDDIEFDVIFDTDGEDICEFMKLISDEDIMENCSKGGNK